MVTEADPSPKRWSILRILLLAVSATTMKSPSGEKATDEGYWKRAEVASPSCRPPSAPARRDTSPVAASTRLILLFAVSATQSHVPSLEYATSVGPLKRATAAAPLIYPPEEGPTMDRCAPPSRVMMAMEYGPLMAFLRRR